MQEHRATGAPTAQRFVRVHGLDLPMLGREPLQGANAIQRIFAPDRPHADGRNLQAGEVQRMGAIARRFRARSRHVDRQQINDPRIAELTGNYAKHGGGSIPSGRPRGKTEDCRSPISVHKPVHNRFGVTETSREISRLDWIGEVLSGTDQSAQIPGM
jgi:hypothetical protein